MAHIYKDKQTAEDMANYYCDKAARKYHVAELIEQSVRQRVIAVMQKMRVTDEDLDTVANDINIWQAARKENADALKDASEARADQLAYEAEQTTTAEEEAEA